MSKVHQLVSHELTFLAFDCKLAVMHAVQHLMQMPQVGWYVSTVHNDIIHICMCTMLQPYQLLIHETLECAGVVGEPEVHHHVFVEPPLANKGCTMLMFGCDLNLVVHTLQVQICEYVAALQTI